MCDLVRRDTLCLKGAELPLKGYSQLLVSLLYMHVKTLYQSAVLQLPSAVMQTYWARSALPSAIMRPFQAVAQMTGLTLYATDCSVYKATPLPHVPAMPCGDAGHT